MNLSRRQFMHSSTAAVVVGGLAASPRVFGANERIRIACVGLKGRGKGHYTTYSQLEGSEVVALCDVDSEVLGVAAFNCKNASGKTPKQYKDMRDVFADAEVDAVTFATPNHWHTLGAIWACEAGKDVYVEKPLSHNIWEGRQLVAAAQKYNRIVQHGTQSRSDATKIRLMRRLQEGVIGDVYMARALCYKRRDSIGHKPDEAPPSNLDWNLWQGPAEERPYNPNYVHYNWHWFWNYGNGDIGNQGVHEMDMAVWGLNKGLPVRVTSAGGRYGYEDQGETANTQIAMFHYADGKMLTFEVRGRATNDEGAMPVGASPEDTPGIRVGNLFYGSKGYTVGVNAYDMDNKLIPDETPAVKNEQTTDHFNNFLTAIRSRSQEDIKATALQGHISSAHCHLANVAYRLRRTLEFNPDAEQFVGDDEANILATRAYRTGFEVPKLA